ncbi:hypothetical protein AEU87_07240 [Salmonella enterica subsp. enterica serovar Typhimurium var. 5-]|nr:hypothetical protein AEU87_07240 [Salmonella enterica subsp. enterica serovar Typhimurium var. 5-]
MRSFLTGLVSSNASPRGQTTEIYNKGPQLKYSVFTITSHYAHRRNALNAILTQIPQKEMFYQAKTGKMRQERFQRVA